MLKSLKIFSVRAETSHEDVFMDRYERMFDWSLQLTDRDVQLSEDLVHDAFIQFLISQPKLEDIRDLDAYFYVMLRNVNISRIRRAVHLQNIALTAADYDSAEIALRVANPRAQLNVREELRLVCHYASVRKETSKAGSLLILRYFQGYYPEEIARVACITRAAVYQWLKLARREVRIYLEHPESLKFMSQVSGVQDSLLESDKGATDFLSELRNMIERSCTSECSADLIGMYPASRSPKSPRSLETEALAHVAACSGCLDQVNRLLGLPLLSERFPNDTLGVEPRSKDRGDGDSGGPSGPTPVTTQAQKQKSKSRLKEVFEHRPSDLFVSVNGYVVGSHAVSSDVNRLSLRVNIEEQINFVEVFSEQGMRLLIHNVAPTPDEVSQKAQAFFSDGRSLNLDLNFDNPWPTVNLLYRDPILAAIESEVVDADGVQFETKNDLEVGDLHRPQVKSSSLKSLVAGFASKRKTVSLKTPLRSVWDIFASPVAVTSVVALLLALSFVVLYRQLPVPASTAEDLLQRSAVAEDAVAANRDLVFHRTISFEERKSESRLVGVAPGLSTGQLIARRRIEIWQSAEKGITARRLYDENGGLIAGDWRREDGVQTIYHHGTSPKLQRLNVQSVNVSDAWQLSPSAREFLSLTQSSDRLKLTETGAAYLINYDQPDVGTQGLIKATLTLSRADLHATEQSLLIRQTDGLHWYNLIETSFESHRPASVAPAVFEPEAILLKGGAELGRRTDAENGALPDGGVNLSPVIATAALEVEVLQLLNQVGADMGEQINVTRAPDGRLRVEGIVDAEQRKSQILRGLAPVVKNPAVVVSLKTVDEALVDDRARARSAPVVIVQGEESSVGTVPLDKELREYFAGRGMAPTAIDNEVRGLSRQALGQSGEVMQHAWALKGLAQRFSADALRTLDPEARKKWLGLIARHASALRRDSRKLTQLLQPIFPSVESGAEVGPLDLSNDALLISAIERLFRECTQSDEVIRSAFSISPDSSKAATLKTGRFANSLRAIDALAQAVSEIEP